MVALLREGLKIKITSRTTGAKGCKFEQFDLYWTIFFIYLGPSCLSESILVCLDLFWFISVYLGPAGFTFLYLFWSISGYIELSKAILDKNWISRAILGYPGLNISNNFLNICYIRGLEVSKIIPFPALKIQICILKIQLWLLKKMGNIL